MLAAFSDAIRKAITNNQYKAALKEAVIEALRDAELQREIVCTISSAAIAASEDQGLRDALLSVSKQALSQALKDEGFMSDMLATMTEATVSAAKNRDLRDSILGVIKDAVADALKDEGFMGEMLTTGSRALVLASQDQELLSAMSNVTKLAVTDALRDGGFQAAFREAVCDSLKDSNIYRGAAAGVVGALNPFGRRGVIGPTSVTNTDSEAS